jgi:chorismate mutase-like protein
MRALLLVWLACAPLWAVAEPLRVGTSGDYAPFSHLGRGFDVEVARRMVADMGMEPVFVPFRWPELHLRLAAGDFDVAMSGITWRPERAVVGFMTRAVAAGGPCLLSASTRLERIGVNRGGFLETWARANFGEAEIVPFDDNRSLPDRLARGEIDALVTDSFELPEFRRPGFEARCEPRAQRKVYWVAPRHAELLGPRIDAWLAEREPALRALRERWLGGASPRSEADHLVDLLARRLALMPHVAAWKHAHQRPIEDLARERAVLERAARVARQAGLDPAWLRRVFAVQIELAKAVQRRAPAPETPLELETEVRPLLLRLGDRIVTSLARGAELGTADPAPLRAWLEPPELERLREVLSR